MQAVKGNKVYSIAEHEKKHYIDTGFDILDDNGNIIAYGRGKTVPYDTYMNVVKELEELKQSIGSQEETQEAKESKQKAKAKE